MRPITSRGQKVWLALLCLGALGPAVIMAPWILAAEAGERLLRRLGVRYDR